MSYKTEADGTYKEIMHTHCRYILDGAIYNKSFKEISDYYVKKISGNKYYDDIIKRYENIIMMVKTYEENSANHYKYCLDWLKKNAVSLKVVYSDPSISLPAGGKSVKTRKVNGLDFYTEKLRDHFFNFKPSSEDITKPKLLAKYQIGPGDGIQSWLLLEKINDKWSPAQEDIIQRVLGKKLPSEGKNTGLYDILSDEYLGEPDSTITDVRLTIPETIKVNLDELKKNIEEFEKFNKFKIKNKKRKSKITDKTPEQLKDIADIKGFEMELANVTNGGTSMVTDKASASSSTSKSQGDENMDQPKNIILYGPPGTGKTYSTVERAVKILRGEDFVNDIRSKNPDNEKEVYNQLKDEYKKQVADNHIKFVTFHQSYGYEDFIEGIKPVLTDDDKASSGQNAQNKSAGTQVSYRIEDGVFKEFCKNADPSCVGEADENEQEASNQPSIDDAYPENEDHGEQKAPEESNDKLPYVFIIDEINRGNISKIFGELITLIEETKRKGEDEETSTILPYSKKRFFVPKNVYIIGTMNTADRSLAVVDTALRRRFTFEEMMHKPELVNIDINDGKGGIINIKNLLTIMNKRITALCDREHTIGHSFFMELKDKPSMDSLADIMKNKIIPLLQEYFYEDYENIRLVLGDNQKEKDEPEFIKQMPLEDDLFGKRDTPKITEGENIYFYEINEKAFKDVKAYAYLGWASHMNDGTSSSENPASETAKNDTAEKTPGEGNE